MPDGEKLEICGFDWKPVALHALSDLRALGVDIEQLLVIPAALKGTVSRMVDNYDQEMSSYS